MVRDVVVVSFVFVCLLAAMFGKMFEVRIITSKHRFVHNNRKCFIDDLLLCILVDFSVLNLSSSSLEEATCASHYDWKEMIDALITTSKHRLVEDNVTMLG